MRQHCRAGIRLLNSLSLVNNGLLGTLFLIIMNFYSFLVSHLYICVYKHIVPSQIEKKITVKEKGAKFTGVPLPKICTLLCRYIICIKYLYYALAFKIPHMYNGVKILTHITHFRHKVSKRI